MTKAQRKARMAEAKSELIEALADIEQRVPLGLVRKWAQEARDLLSTAEQLNWQVLNEASIITLHLSELAVFIASAIGARHVPSY